MSVIRWGAFLLALCGVPWCGIAAAEPAPEIGREPASEPVRWLREYIQIDTTNPPGNEGEAVAFLAGLLKSQGISSRTLTSPEGRSSLYARLEAPGSQGRAVVLLHHIDVVSATGEWEVEPFSGRPYRGKVWGRGALDVKGVGVAQLAALAALVGSDRPRQRDVIFLAVADEEAGGRQGAAWLLAEHPELFAGAEAVLNEGGSNRVLNDRILWWGIEVTQKRPLWLKVTARGRGGHASGLRPHSPTHRLVTALARLIERPLVMRSNAAAMHYLTALARLEGGRASELVRRLEAGDDPATLALAPGQPVYFLDTVQVTEIDNGQGSNIIAATASASIDIRLLPDTDGEAFLNEVRDILGPELEVEVLLDAPRVDASPTDHPVYRALEQALGVRAPVVPSFISGTTDSRFFRQQGIPAYGLSPFTINSEDLRGIHARNESIPVDAFLRGIETVYRFLQLYVEGDASSGSR